MDSHKHLFTSNYSIYYYIILLLFFSSLVQSQVLQLPLFFDFGPPESQVQDGFIPIYVHSTFQQSKGYGLTGTGVQYYLRKGRNLATTLNIDGLLSKGFIEFKVDVAPGDYWVELIMDGGQRTLWSGDIFVNGQPVEKEVHHYTVSNEGEEPPPFWSILCPISSNQNSVVVRITAQEQVTTIAGLLLLPDDIGPVILADGKLVTREELSAPNSNLILNLLNQGAVSEAQKLIDSIPEERFAYEKAHLLIALAGRIEIENPRAIIEWAVRLLEDVAEKKDRNVALQIFLLNKFLQADSYHKMAGWDWARFYSGAGIFDRQVVAGQFYDEIVQVKDFPLYNRTLWELGKLSFMAWLEEHGQHQFDRANDCFNILKPYYPHHILLKMYSGEKIPYEKGLSPVNDPNAPDWVLKTSQALKSLQDVIHYWVNNRQAENGEFGGKFDDDVEMLRWWPVSRLAANDSIALLGMQRLVDGIWNSDWIENGFCAQVRDVEHAAEPVADTQPMMIGLDYGNPVYVERCMESVKGLRDVWTGINSKGHRHFKSSWYSATEIDTNPPKDCDVPYNTRTVRVARWLAWYNRHPFALQFLQEWGDAWLEDCLRTDKGKPFGIVPPAIHYTDDAISEYGENWYEPGLFWSYFNFSGGTRMMQQFLSIYVLTGEKKYLQPIELAMKLVGKYKNENTENAKKGSEAWVAHILKKSRGFANALELWRLLTNNSDYDDLVSEFGSEYLKFRLTGDVNYLTSGSEHIVDGLLYNRELITTEGYFTDRINIGDMHKGARITASHLEAMYTGGALVNGFYPYYAVSWNGFDNDFVAAVSKSGSKEIEIIVYNLNTETMEGSLTCWMLAPGTYEYKLGHDTDGDLKPDLILVEDEFKVASRSASHKISLPARQMCVIQIKKIANGYKETPVDLADVAITKKELLIDRNTLKSTVSITIPVHNIGIKAVENIDVELRLCGDKETTLAHQTIIKLDAPLDLEPKIAEVTFILNNDRLISKNLYIIVDPENEIPEITLLNNRIECQLNP